MPMNIASFLIAALFVGIGLSALVRTLIKLRSPVRTVDAVVAEKRVIEEFSKYSGSGKREKYAVVFSVEGVEKTFYVSRFSYEGYHVGEKGALKYQGDKLISFM